jgi:hypothetical protein
LVAEALRAQKDRRNRQLLVSRVEELSPTQKYPVVFHMMEGDGAYVRCQIALSEEVEVELDVLPETFGRLPTAEV